MSTTYTFKVCDATTGIPTAFVPQFSDASCSIEMSDIGSISFSYLKTGVNYSLLDASASGPVEIALFQDGVEMDDGRFRIQSSTDDELDHDDVTQFVGVSLAQRLTAALVYSADGSFTQGIDQVFTGTSGFILKTLFDQNAARGSNRVMDQITYASFSNTLDSNGAAWAFTLADITYRVGINYLDVMRNMVNNGMIEFKMVGRDLRVYNAGTMGIDRTITAEPVVLRKGRDLTEAPRTRTSEQVAAVVLTQGDGGVLFQQIDASVGAAWGFDETFLSQGGVADITTLGVLSQQEIDRRSQVRIQNTHKVALQASPYRPGVDYAVSDYIFTDRGSGPVRLRIRQMVLQIDPGAVTYASIVLNDKFLEREIAIARRVDGILGGASAGGSVAIPVGPDPGEDLTTPKDPTSLTCSSNVYVTEDGRSVTSVGMVWPAVTQNTDNSSITDLSHYETSFRFDGVDTVIPPTTYGTARDDAFFTHLFDRRSKAYGWVGGDGGASTRATSGKDFWLFADTFIGIADGDGRLASNYSFIHNSVVVTDPSSLATFDSRYGMGNRLSANDAFLETTVGLWQADTNCSVVRDTVSSFYGTGSLKITATGAGDAIARIAAPATSNYPVVAGTTYSAMCKVKTFSGTARNVQIGIRWYNAANALLSTTTSVGAIGSTSSWIRYNVAGAAPTLAVKAAVVVTVNSAAAAQVFNVDTIGLAETDQVMASWNDPNRGALGAPVSLVNPEDIGGTQIAAGSLANTIYWVDDVVNTNGKIYGFMTRFTPVGVFQNAVHVAIWDATTHVFEGVVTFTTSDVVQWGCATYVTGGFLYIYGVDTSNPATAQDMFLMRVPNTNVTGGTKEFLLNVGAGTWTTTRASAVSIYTGFMHHFGNIDFRNGVYNSIITIYGSGELRRLQATVLQGPWTDQGVIFTQPNTGGGTICYFPRVHPQLSDNSGILMSYSVNGDVGGVTVAEDVRQYAPKFARGPAATQVAVVPATIWSHSRVVPVGTTSDFVGDIPSGWNFQGRVRAVDSNGHWSIWRESATIRTSSDITPPNRPSKPIVSSQFQGIRVEWDGFDFQGGPPPVDWERLEIHISLISNFTPGTSTLRDTLITRLGGVSPIQGLIYGETYYARFVAVDVRGNRSDPSDVSTAQPEQLVDTAEIANKLIQGAMIADSTIAVRSITVAAFDPSIVPNGSFEDEATNADGTGTGLPSYWSPSFWIIGAGATVAYDTTTPLAGTKSIKMTMATAADGLRYASAKFPVTAGRLLAASVKVRASRTITNPAFELHIVCGNTEANTGGFPSAGVSEWGLSSTITGTTSIQKLELQRIVDANMKFAQVFVTCKESSDGSGWVGTIDEVEVRPVGGSAFIADASILNAKIANLAVDNAKIASVEVGKLTAGILSADITVSARIKTANTGARVEINSSGLQAFNSSNVKTVDIAAATGNAIFTGSFRTDFPTSTNPHMELYDSGDRTSIFFTNTSGMGISGNTAFINTVMDGFNNPRLGLNASTFTMLGDSAARHRLFLNNSFMQLETNGASTKLGFNLAMWDNGMELQRTAFGGSLTGGSLQATHDTFNLRLYNGGVLDGGQVSSNNTTLFLDANASGTVMSRLFLKDDGIWGTTGKMLNNYTFNNFTDDFIIAGGGTSLGGSTTNHTIVYGATATSLPAVAVGPYMSALTNWRMSSITTTGFAVETSASTTAKIQYWAFRL